MALAPGGLNAHRSEESGSAVQGVTLTGRESTMLPTLPTTGSFGESASNAVSFDTAPGLQPTRSTPEQCHGQSRRMGRRQTVKLCSREQTGPGHAQTVVAPLSRLLSLIAIRMPAATTTAIPVAAMALVGRPQSRYAQRQAKIRKEYSKTATRAAVPVR